MLLFHSGVGGCSNTPIGLNRLLSEQLVHRHIDFRSQRQCLNAAKIASSGKVAIVGLNVHPVDRHIWEPLSQTNGQIFYLGGPLVGLSIKRGPANLVDPTTL